MFYVSVHPVGLFIFCSCELSAPAISSHYFGRNTVSVSLRVGLVMVRYKPCAHRTVEKHQQTWVR